MTTATAALRGPLRKRESNLWARVWLRGYDGSPEVRWLRRDA